MASLSPLEDLVLNSDQVRYYTQNGHVLVKEVAPPSTLRVISDPLRASVRKVMETKDPQGRVENYGGMFQQVTNVWRLDPVLREFIFSRRFAKIAADLMGVHGIRLYHDQALFKPRGGKPTPWHQDQIYWPLDTEKTITMWMPLVPVDDTTGTMSFVDGSHRTGSLLDAAIGMEAETFFEGWVKEGNRPVTSYALAPGDATFHAGWTVHRAYPNTGDRMREVITIIYYADGTRIMTPDSKYRQVDMEVFHPGQKPGDLAASELNPLLYP
jgi:ectoine hydroxylase-related dioxygenase (phytanoyl-CoA dioxygenase family)